MLLFPTSLSTALPRPLPTREGANKHSPPEQSCTYAPVPPYLQRPASIPIDSLPSRMPPLSLYSTWHNLKSPHPFLCSPVPTECESEVMGPCVSLVTALSPESPVCLTPVGPQKQLLRTNGERRGPRFCSGWCRCLALHLWSSFFSH